MFEKTDLLQLLSEHTKFPPVGSLINLFPVVAWMNDLPTVLTMAAP